MKLHRLAAAMLMATAAVAAHAEVTVSPMVGFHMFDNDTLADNSDIRDDVEASLALGYRVVPNVGLELRYGQSNPLSRGAGSDVRYEAATLDTYYRFNADRKLQPYVLIGGGLARGTQAGYVEHTIANAAVGAFYQVTDALALRGELREVEDLQASAHDGIASLGVLFSFGGKKAAVAAPAAVAAVVAAKPAPVVVPADDDKDGVVNSADQCPGTAAGVVVDANGCPKVVVEKVSKELHVQFDTNKAVVKPEYNAEIEGVAKLLKEYSSAKVEVQGHTDSRGQESLNSKLSQERADAVANILVKNYGIAADRVSAKGYGSSQPVADNKTAEGQAKNRRVVAVAEGEVKVTVKK